MMQGNAYFVFRPRTVAELSQTNQAGRWRSYRIVKTICLSEIDYENFATDLLADRQFIEDNAALCTTPEDCLLIVGTRSAGALLSAISGLPRPMRRMDGTVSPVAVIGRLIATHSDPLDAKKYPKFIDIFGKMCHNTTKKQEV